MVFHSTGMITVTIFYSCLSCITLWHKMWIQRALERKKRIKRALPLEQLEWTSLTWPTWCPGPCNWSHLADHRPRTASMETAKTWHTAGTPFKWKQNKWRNGRKEKMVNEQKSFTFMMCRTWCSRTLIVIKIKVKNYITRMHEWLKCSRGKIKNSDFF